MAIVTAVRNPQHSLTIEAAKAAGYVKSMIADGGGIYGNVEVLVRRSADLDSLVVAFDVNELEWVIVQGFNVDWSEA